mmetsp:Transcript_8877/g.21623  ORF Transcript_8877/g.21623 Transcript_8877/m.21623 type:complete len:247 (+) Transcript_8877:505-1245(+)
MPPSLDASRLLSPYMDMLEQNSSTGVAASHMPMAPPIKKASPLMNPFEQVPGVGGGGVHHKAGSVSTSFLNREGLMGGQHQQTVHDGHQNITSSFFDGEHAQAAPGFSSSKCSRSGPPPMLKTSFLDMKRNRPGAAGEVGHDISRGVRKSNAKVHARKTTSFTTTEGGGGDASTTTTSTSGGGGGGHGHHTVTWVSGEKTECGHWTPNQLEQKCSSAGMGEPKLMVGEHGHQHNAASKAHCCKAAS